MGFPMVADDRGLPLRLRGAPQRSGLRPGDVGGESGVHAGSICRSWAEDAKIQQRSNKDPTRIQQRSKRWGFFVWDFIFLSHFRSGYSNIFQGSADTADTDTWTVSSWTFPVAPCWSQDLLKDPDFILAAIRSNPWALALAPAEMQKDRDFLLKVQWTSHIPSHIPTERAGFFSEIEIIWGWDVTMMPLL